MLNPPSQTQTDNDLVESIHEFNEDSFFDMRSEDMSTWTAQLTPIGYDEEIGLWEELEGRYRRGLSAKAGM
jgi:hypothetical protein